MDINNLKGLMEAYQQVNAPQEVDEATAMAKRGYDEAPIRQKIAKSTGGGESADRASALEKKSTFGDANKEKQRQNLARKQRGDFRKTTSSSPGLHVGQHKSDDPKVKEKQAARGAQRGALTPVEKKQFNREEFDIFDVVLEFLQAEGYAETLEEAEWMMANLIDEEAVAIILGEEQLDEVLTGDRYKKVMKKPGGMAYSRKVSADPAKRATRGGRGGESDFGAGDRGSGNKAARRAGTYKEYDVNEAITSEKGKAKAAEMIAKRTTASGRAKPGQGDNVATIKHIGRSNRDGLLGTPPNRKVAGSNWPKSYSGIGGSGNKAARRAGTYQEDFELWVNELVEEGYDLSDCTWDEMYEFYLDEAIYSEKGKAKAAEMIAKRSTPSGRAKSGKGANVAQIRQIRGSGRGRFDREGLGGTPMTPTMAKNPIKKQNYDGTGNKAARRAGTYQEAFESWLDEAMSNYEKNRKRAAARAEERNRLRQAGKLSGPMERISLRDKFGDAAGTRMAKAKPPGPGEKY